MTTGIKTELAVCDETFKKNGEYDFRFEGVGEWNGDRYLLLSYGESRAITVRGMEKTDYVFRAKLLPYQQDLSFEELQGTVRCRVKDFMEGNNGQETAMPNLDQCYGPIFAKYYEVGKEYAFKVCECPGSVLKNGQVTRWYTLVDFMNFKHRYWSVETLRIGDVRIGDELNRLTEAERSDLMSDSVPTEYTSSFAFSHGDPSPDVDKRLGSEIMMRIAALANSDGGRILVGITPEMTYRGIAQDLPYLNASSEDGGAYPRTLEGLRQKILDTIAKKLGDRAVTLVSIEFHKVEHEKVICEIGVSKSMWPVYFSQKNLYVRNGKERQRLLGDDITRFVLSRLASFAGNAVVQGV